MFIFFLKFTGLLPFAVRVSKRFKFKKFEMAFALSLAATHAISIDFFSFK